MLRRFTFVLAASVAASAPSKLDHVLAAARLGPAWSCSTNASCHWNASAWNREPCFPGCAPRRQNKESSDHHPGLSVVIAWCCEPLAWLWTIEWQGQLVDIWLYDKCGERCDAPAAEVARLRSAAAVRGVRVHVEALQEPGRHRCKMTTDECGAHLIHLTMQYSNLTRGVMFVQGGGDHLDTEAAMIADWASKHSGRVPDTYIPLVGTFLHPDSWCGHRNPGCLPAWSQPLFGTYEDLAALERHGHYSRAAFYVSRTVIRQRPWQFYSTAWEIVRNSSLCNFWSHNECCGSRDPAECDTSRAEVQSTAIFPIPDSDVCSTSEPLACSRPCLCLEHLWAAIFCQPCETPLKRLDPRIPYNAARNSSALVHR